MTAFKQKIWTIAFVSAITLPLLFTYFTVFKSKNYENRTMTPRPLLDISNLDPYPKAYESYFNDNFNLRNILMQGFSKWNVNLFKKSANPSACYIGNDGWMYVALNELAVHSGRISFTDSQLLQLRNILQYRQQYFAERNCKYYLLIVPLKQDIYPEFQPWFIKKDKQQTLAENLIAVMKETDVNIIYAKKALLEAKDKNRVFLKTDNHWTDYGAYCAAKELLSKVSKDFPAVLVPTDSDYVFSTETIQAGNIANMMALSDAMEDDNFRVKKNGKVNYSAAPGGPYPVPNFANSWEYQWAFMVQNDSLPKALIIRDSFGSSIAHYVAENFSRSCFIFDEWKYGMNLPIFENERPDVFIQIVFEGRLPAIIDNATKEELQFKKVSN